MFFSIILGVTIRLMVTQRLHNIFSLLSVIFLSLLLYYTYSWLSNLTSFSKTYLTSEQLHTSPLFYLTVFLCTGFIFLMDFFQQSILVNLMGSPSEYMRKAVNTNKGLPDGWEMEFDRLMKKKEHKYTMEDIAKENNNVKRREKRMVKLEKELEEKREKLRKEAAKKRS